MPLTDRVRTPACSASRLGADHGIQSAATFQARPVGACAADLLRGARRRAALSDARFNTLEIVRGSAWHSAFIRCSAPRSCRATCSWAQRSRRSPAATLRSDEPRSSPRRTSSFASGRTSVARSSLHENARLRALLCICRSGAQATPPRCSTTRAIRSRKRSSSAGLRSRASSMARRSSTKTACIGQVTRVFPLQSEVTLLTDKDQAVPVSDRPHRLAQRRSTARRRATRSNCASCRSAPTSQAGDELVTSGLDGVYPPGCRWRRSYASTGRRIRRSRASSVAGRAGARRAQCSCSITVNACRRARSNSKLLRPRKKRRKPRATGKSAQKAALPAAGSAASATAPARRLQPPGCGKAPRRPPPRRRPRPPSAAPRHPAQEQEGASSPARVGSAP